MKWLSLLKYMAPGVIAAIVAAIYFSNGSSTFITIVLFCSLITYAIVTSRELSALKDDLKQIEDKYLTILEYEVKGEANDKEIENLNDKINFVAQAASSEIDNLADNVGSEIHEIALMIADRRFGPDEDGEDA